MYAKNLPWEFCMKCELIILYADFIKVLFSYFRLSLIQSFNFKPGSSIQLAKLRVNIEPSIACRQKEQ